jgi:hypothetical protein
MKTKSTIICIFLVLSINCYSQTLFVPSGTSGISSSSNENVGIGTSAPENQLDVRGAISLGSGSVNANTTKLFVRNPAGKTWAISSGTNAVTQSSFSIYNWTDNQTTPFLHISSSGNVGISTSAPGCFLDVADTSANTLKTVLARLQEGNSIGEGTYLGIKSYNTQPGIVNSFSIEHKFYGMLNSSINFYRGGATTGGFLTFSTNNNSERMRIDAIGYVGIGTSAPENQLDVKGGISLGSGSVNSNTTKLFVKNPAGKTWAISSGANSVTESSFSIYNWTDNQTTPFLHISSSGNVGIGTSSPVCSLDVANNSTNTLKTVLARLPEGNSIGEGTYLGIKSYNTQPGIVNSFSIEHKFYGILNSSINFYRGGATTGGFLTFSTNDNTEKMRITAEGLIGIGTANPAYKLDVLGTIRAKEVKVDLNGTADFVFDSNYKLRPLSEVEQYVKEHKHLQEIPSAKEVEQNGVSLGEMQNKLLQKVEELTLYTIEQNKKLDQQNLEIKKQNEKIQDLEEKIEKMEPVSKRVDNM